MKQDISHLKNLINSAKLLADNISQSVNYNTPFDNRTQQLAGIVKQIIPLIKNNCPEIANILEKATSRIINRQVVPMVPYGPMVNKDFINAFFFGDIRTTINILSILYPLQEQGGYKIFISHSSDDETIVNAFIKDILIVGCGFRRTEIFCTLDHTVIRTGDDFRNEIIENMKRCDYILCMISDNYRKSEVCQNELGAAWAMTGKRVLPFKFPNINFKEIGFLNVVKQTADLTDKSKLDELYDELCRFYDLPQDWRNFNQQKDDFIKVVNENVYE
jgi:hypothetical protein